MVPKEGAAYLSLGETGSRLMMGKSGSLSTPCSCFSLYSFCRSTSWCRSRSLRGGDEPSGHTLHAHGWDTHHSGLKFVFLQFWAE